MQREELRQTLLDILEQETWERPEKFDDSVRIRDELKLDSVDLLSVALRAETTLGISLDSRDFDKVTTVGNLLTVLEKKLAAQRKNKAA